MRKIFVYSLLLIFIGCNDKAQNWVILFDGNNVNQWRGFKQVDFPFDGWAIEEGTLKTIVGGNRVDIITKEIYEDFEFALEWKVSPAGNLMVVDNLHLQVLYMTSLLHQGDH